MGQKVHPVGFRLGIVKDWDSKWYANKLEYADLLHEDLEIKSLIKQRFYQAGISKTEIERAANRAKVTIHTGRPGMVIGRGGAEVDKLRKDLEAMTGRQIQVNIVEVKTPETNAQLVAESIAFALKDVFPSAEQCARLKPELSASAPRVLRWPFPVVLAAQKSLVPSGARKVPFRCIPSGQTLITGSQKRTQHLARLGLRYGFTMARSCRKQQPRIRLEGANRDAYSKESKVS